jgi:hypothetical protein
MRVTMSTSPSRRKSSTVRRASRHRVHNMRGGPTGNKSVLNEVNKHFGAGIGFGVPNQFVVVIFDSSDNRRAVGKVIQNMSGIAGLIYGRMRCPKQLCCAVQC